jgi:Peptidase family M28/PDZ domain
MNVRRLASALLVAGALGGASGLPLYGGSYTSAVSTITRQDLRRHCEFLASDALQGRETGSQGGQAAGAYIVTQLRKLKVRPAGTDGDYYQPFQNRSQNILCRLPGSDRALAKEYIIVGAHYDHVGFGNPRNSRGPIGFIHNGADDNASGTATLLELVKAFTSLDATPRRSIVFVFWDAEEQGLLGSEYWTQYPTVSLEGLKLVVNIDMVGRLRENRAECLGSRTAPGLRGLIATSNSDPGVSLSFPWTTQRDSDHYPFFARQIPYLMIFTGKHPDYHTPGDRVEKLNIDGMERVSRLLFRTVYAAADARRLPGFRQAAFQETNADQEAKEAPAALPPARLGVTWDETLALKHTIEVAQIDPGSAAESAGIRPGDRILKFDGVTIRDPADLREAVLDSLEDTKALVAHRGETAPRTVRVHLYGPAHPAGILCRSDDAEPGCVIVSRVVPGAAGQRAGLRANDRIRRLDRQSCASPEQFAAQLLRPTGTHSLQVDRDGELKALTVELPQHAADGSDSPDSPR